jgi:hypothetical protein
MVSILAPGTMGVWTRGLDIKAGGAPLKAGCAARDPAVGDATSGKREPRFLEG